uniref:Uncharacterized protein n=1 Tax=Lygus hesperus TaxID=30085 RepID=A0A146LJC2_LYGHE
MYNNHRLRPLRNNYRGRLAIGKRGEDLFVSLDDPPERTRKSMRRISLLATPGATSSSEEQDEEYARRRRRMLPRRSLTHETSARSTRSSSQRLSIPNSSNPEDGIRRSTRKRNLKFQNVNDSWIVGAQSLKGYPVFSRDYDKRESEEWGDVEEEEEEEE